MDQAPIIKLIRPCGRQYPDGKQFGEWGPRWGYHFDENGAWVKGKVGGRGQHGGYDIVCPIGTVLRAPANGKVLESGWQDPKNEKRGYGQRIILELSDPVDIEGVGLLRPLLTIGHFSEIWLPKGAMVMAVDDMGLSGDTGNASGAHTHCQLEIPWGSPRRPIPFEWGAV